MFKPFQAAPEIFINCAGFFRKMIVKTASSISASQRARSFFLLMFLQQHPAAVHRKLMEIVIVHEVRSQFVVHRDIKTKTSESPIYCSAWFCNHLYMYMALFSVSFFCVSPFSF